MICIQVSWGLGVHMCVHVYACGCAKLWDDGWMMNFAFWDDILNKSMAQDWDDRGMTLKTAKKDIKKPWFFKFLFILKVIIQGLG